MDFFCIRAKILKKPVKFGAFSEKLPYTTIYIYERNGML